jgi:hypothetical protein
MACVALLMLAGVGVSLVGGILLVRARPVLNTAADPVGTMARPGCVDVDNELATAGCKPRGSGGDLDESRWIPLHYSRKK